MTFKFEFTAQEVNLIGKALAELPFKEVVQLFTKIQSVVTTQGADPPPNQSGEQDGGPG
jgi:hypothetical protein